MRSFRIRVLLSIACSWIKLTLAEIKPDGICNVNLLAPFVTNDGRREIYGVRGEIQANLGFLQLASALLAVQHFNSRNATLVPEIANISTSCNVKLNISKVFNAIQDDHSFIQWAARHDPPCAIVGGNDDATGNEVKVTAVSLSIPLVATRTFDPSVASDTFASSIYPNLGASASRIVQFLRFKSRTNFIAILYESSALNLKRREALITELDKMNMRSMSSSFVSDSSGPGSVYTAMKRIKDMGYRTIIIAQDHPWKSYQLIADAAEQLGMNRGGHFYLWYDEWEPSVFKPDTGNANATKLIAGSTWIIPIVLQEIADKTWGEQGDDLMNAAIALNPFRPGERGYVKPIPNFFQKVDFEYTCPEMYDAIISVGLAACKAQAMNESKFVSGINHQSRIRESEFFGFSGLVKFGTARDYDLGSRRGDTVFWAAANFLANDSIVSLPDWIIPAGQGFPEDVNRTLPTGIWVARGGARFVYADGTTTPPSLLRDTPEQNYIWVGLRIIGFTLTGICMVTAIVCAGWVFVCRKHKVFKAAQPEFLYLICFGALVQSSAILPASFDENSGWSTEQLSEACMAIPWLFVLGYTIVYSSLFTKLWRVNKVLQFARREIKIQHVVWPMLLLVLVELLILILWTCLEPLQWERVELNSSTGESMGSCQSSNPYAFVAPLGIVMLIPSILTLFMAWKTKDVDEAFSESRWIFAMVFLQIEVILVAVPVVVILSGKSSNGKYLGLLFFFWYFAMSTLGLILFPKIVAYRQAVLLNDQLPRHKRGERGNSRVTGADYVTGSSSQSEQVYRSGKSGIMSPGQPVDESILAKMHNKVESSW